MPPRYVGMSVTEHQLVTAPVDLGPVRLCPACDHGEPLPEHGDTWPLDWVCRACGHATPVRDGIALTAPALADTLSGFNPSDYSFLAGVERWHFWFVVRRRLLVALANKYAPNARACIEIGCGSGNVVEALASSRKWERIVGTEIHPSGLALARRRMPPSVELLQVDARHLPFRDAFDLAGAFDVLEHIVEDEAVIDGVRSGLVLGGIFLVAVPQHPRLWSVADDVAYHVRRYRRGELEKKLVGGGFDVLFSTSYATSLLPIMLLSRRLATSSATDSVDARALVRKEFDLTPTANRLLAAILGGETALTRCGVRWPIGGSRVVVARKR